MDKWKKRLWKLLFPHTVLVFILFNVSAVLLVYALGSASCPAVIAYASYIISFYTLVIVCARIPSIIKIFKERLYANKYMNIYLTRASIRVRTSMYGGLVLNICFAIFKVVMGILYRTQWLFAMAGYNVILSIMRFVLVRRDITDRNEDEQTKRFQGLQSYKVCGWLMLLLNVAISVIVIMVVLDNQTITYPGFMIYAIAAFTFYYLTMAIIDVVKYRKRSTPVFSAVKRIELAKAMVSVFTLQVAMLTQFGADDDFNYQIVNGATGGAVCVMITVMAILMLTGVKKDYAMINEENEVRG